LKLLLTYLLNKGLPTDNFIGDKFNSLLRHQYPLGLNITTDYQDRTQSAFIVSKMDIANEKYDLSINRYKQVVYTTEQHEDPKIILTRLKELEKNILSDLNELGEML